jgi:plastocyanin
MKNLSLHALLIILGLSATAASKPETGTVKGTITVKAGASAKKDRKGVVIYLENVPGTPPKQKNATIKQREKQFDPPLTIVVKGTTIDFPNEDKIFHNVFSVSRPARFDLGLYKSGTAKSVEMKRSGVVDVYCNIHPDMIAKVKVLDNGFYTISGPDGKFEIQGIPAGEYPIVAWLPTGGEVSGKVTIKAGEAASVDLEVSEVATNTTHTRKDGTPYGRYK